MKTPSSENDVSHPLCVCNLESALHVEKSNELNKLLAKVLTP